ncbi:MAG: hypothetical protein J6W51_03995 [Fibrobacter sp.]|nr:hypothetical protein [Fibrobacter sp.]
MQKPPVHINWWLSIYTKKLPDRRSFYLKDSIYHHAGEAKGESNAISVFEKLGVSPEKIAEAKAMLAALANK